MQLSSRQERNVKIVVVSCVALFFVLVVTLTITIGVRVSHRAQVNRLEEQQARLRAQLNDVERDLSYFDTGQFIEDFARELGWIRPGQGLWT